MDIKIANNSYATSLVYAKTNQNVKLAESRANDSGVEYIHSEEASYTTYTVDMVKANSSNVYIIEQEEIQLENFESGIYTDEVSATSLMPSEVQACQNQLRALDLYHGSTDGNAGSEEMVKAISQFQKAYGLAETGTLNSLTVNKLNRIYSDFINVYNSEAMDTVVSEFWLDSDEKKNFAIMWSFLKNEMDLNTHQIAGVMGNIKAESGFSADNAENSEYDGDHNPEYVYNTGDGVGYGLLQWTTLERKTGLKNMSDQLDLEVSNINVQLAYFKKEMQEGYSTAWNQIKHTYNYATVSDIFLDEIESPLESNYQERREFASIIYEAFR